MLTTTTTRISYTGNGVTTVFTYPFKIHGSSHLAVYVNGVLVTNYSVAGVGNDAGGSITFTPAPANGAAIIILRNAPVVQADNYVDHDALPAETLEDSLDYARMIDQQLKEELGRSIKFLPSSAKANIAAPEPGAGYYWRWNVAGTAVEAVPVVVTDPGTFLQSGTGAVVRTVQSKLGDWLSVKDFGAKGDASTDDTAAIQACINEAAAHNFGIGAGGGVFFPAGVYKTTDTLTISAARVHLLGVGKHASVLLFTPGSNNKPCVHFTTGINAVLYQCSMRQMGIMASGAATGKIGIQATDNSELAVEDVAMLMGTSGASVGLKTNGRELFTFSRLSISAVQPVIISNNPNHTIDIDHSLFLHCGLLGVAGSDIITIEDGVNVFNLSMDGHAWVGGRHGLFWDSNNAAADFNVAFRNIRREQDSGGKMFHIDRTGGSIRNMLFENIEGTSGGDGILLRNCINVGIRNYWYLYTGVALDLDSSNKGIRIDNFERQSGSSLTIGAGLQKIWSLGEAEVGGYIGDRSSLYDAPTGGVMVAPQIAAGAGTGMYRPTGILHQSVTSVPTAGTSEETLATYTLPANTLSVNGRGIRVTAAFTTANNGNAKTPRIRWGGTGGNPIAQYLTTLANGAGIRLVGELYRTGASAQVSGGTGTSHNNVPSNDVDASHAASMASAIDIVVRGHTPTAAGDLTLKYFQVELL